MFKKLKLLKTKEPPQTKEVPEPPLKRVSPLAIVVDDEDDLRRTLKMMLESANYHVRDFKDCTEAIRYIEEPGNVARLVLVVSDLMMANQDGIDLLGTIRKRPWLDHVKFFLVTGADPSVFKDLLAPYHIDGIIEKPFDRLSLRHRVRPAHFLGRLHQSGSLLR